MGGRRLSAVSVAGVKVAADVMQQVGVVIGVIGFVAVFKATAVAVTLAVFFAVVVVVVAAAAVVVVVVVGYCFLLGG